MSYSKGKVTAQDRDERLAAQNITMKQLAEWIGKINFENKMKKFFRSAPILESEKKNV